LSGPTPIPDDDPTLDEQTERDLADLPLGNV
jgi:hypothetical protein